MNVLKPPAVQLPHIRDHMVGNHSSSDKRKKGNAFFNAFQRIYDSLSSDNIFIISLSWKALWEILRC